MGDGTPHNSDDIGAPRLNNARDGMDDTPVEGVDGTDNGAMPDRPENDASDVADASATVIDEGRALAPPPTEPHESTPSQRFKCQISVLQVLWYAPPACLLPPCGRFLFVVKGHQYVGKR